jgi:hypothetical protein
VALISTAAAWPRVDGERFAADRHHRYLGRCLTDRQTAEVLEGMVPEDEDPGKVSE